MRRLDMRQVVNGVMDVLSTGCQWRYIPKDLPPRSTVNRYFCQWSYDGTLKNIHHALYLKCREAAEREASPTAKPARTRSQPDRLHYRQPKRQERGKGGGASIRTVLMAAN